MSNQRTVLCESISYIGTDGESHIAHRGDKISVANEDVQHFDWVHDASVEARQAAIDKKIAAGEKATKTQAKPKAEPEDADKA